MDMGILNTLLSSNNAWFSLAKQAKAKQSYACIEAYACFTFVLSLFLQDYTRVLLVKTQLAGSSRPQASENQTVGSVCNFLLRSYFN
jgi:hypothetical protein